FLEQPKIRGPRHSPVTPDRAPSPREKEEKKHHSRAVHATVLCLSCGCPHLGGMAMKWRRRQKLIYLAPLVLSVTILLAAILTLGGSPPQAADDSKGNLPTAFNVSHAKNTFETFLVAMESQ